MMVRLMGFKEVQTIPLARQWHGVYADMMHQAKPEQMVS